MRGKFQDFVMLSQKQRRYFRNMFLKFGNTWGAWIMSNILSGYLGKSSYSTVGYLQSPNGADVCGVRYVIGRQSPRIVCYCDSVMSHRCHQLAHVICDAAMIWQWLVHRAIMSFNATPSTLTRIEAEKKWPPFRRHYQTHFPEWKC